jgi:hypothetical protein
MSKFSLKDIFSGEIFAKEWFRQQYKLIILIASLIFLYVYIGYETQRQQHRLSSIQKKVEDAYFVKTTLNAELMSSTRQSIVAEELQRRGSTVKESKIAPLYIE